MNTYRLSAEEATTPLGDSKPTPRPKGKQAALDAAQTGAPPAAAASQPSHSPDELVGMVAGVVSTIGEAPLTEGERAMLSIFAPGAAQFIGASPLMSPRVSAIAFAGTAGILIARRLKRKPHQNGQAKEDRSEVHRGPQAQGDGAPDLEEEQLAAVRRATGSVSPRGFPNTGSEFGAG